jgi:hypothetical protein
MNRGVNQNLYDLEDDLNASNKTSKLEIILNLMGGCDE